MFDDILGEKEEEKTNKNNSQSKDLNKRIIDSLKVIEDTYSFIVDKLENDTKEKFLKGMENIYNDRENFIEQCIHPIIDEIDKIRKEINKGV